MPQKTKTYIPQILFGLILCICLIAILRINFSGNPEHYQTDMYSDMTYAVRVWETKSLFPEGWVFGNQLYVLATPVLAALFYGFTGDPVLAMGLASSVMTVGVLLSFGWMLRPVLPKGQERLAAVVLLLLLTLMAGDPVYSLTGWQLMFTMCSYYACYLIAAFLAFGCYLRCEEPFTPWLWAVFAVACLLSFTTGMQSLRQTAVMICPLLAVELCRCVLRLVKKEPLNRRGLLVVGGLSAANVFGLICARVLPIEQVEIFGGIGLNSLSEMLASVVPSVFTALSLLLPVYTSILFAGLAGVPVLWGLVMWKLIKQRDEKSAVCLLLFTASVLVILAIDIATTMDVRVIYYFMLFPLGAVVAALLYSRFGKIMRGMVTVGCVGLLGVCCFAGLLAAPAPADDAVAKYEAVADDLTDRGITTVYSAWNHGEKVAIASEWELAAGFWDTAETSFRSIRYLCDPSVYDATPTECAYLFLGEDAGLIAGDIARQRGADFTLLQYYPDVNLYVYVSDVNLME